MLTSKQITDIREALIKVNGSKVKAARLLGIGERTLYRRLEEIPTLDRDIITEAVRTNKQLQKSRDQNRLSNKTFREHARIENAVECYASEIKEILTTHKFKQTPQTKKLPTINSKSVGVIHWSDHHLNEQVTLPNNIYNWEIASKRLRKHVLESIGYFKYKKIKSVIIAMSGDLINSDRRLDELMVNAGNRSKASVLAVDLYQQAILEIAKHFHITVVAVCGNESRITKDIGWSPEVVTDSYDFTIHEMLSLLLKNTNVVFKPMTNPNEAIVSVYGYNLLIVHGHSSSIKKEKQTSVQALIGKITSRNIIIHMVIWGHVHECGIADNYARSSSLVGANNYSEDSLGLSSRASQNVYAMHENGGFDGLKIDLQCVKGVKGYDLTKRLECYHSKAADKCNTGETVFKIVI